MLPFFSACSSVVVLVPLLFTHIKHILFVCKLVLGFLQAPDITLLKYLLRCYCLKLLLINLCWLAPVSVRCFCKANNPSMSVAESRTYVLGTAVRCLFPSRADPPELSVSLQFALMSASPFSFLYSWNMTRNNCSRNV